VEAVEKSPPPHTTFRERQVFLGLVNFYRRFLPGVTVKFWPLMDALRGNRSANEKLTWTTEMETGFVVARNALSRAKLLGHHSLTAHLALHVDISLSHIGAALHQLLKDHSTWQPLGFFIESLRSGKPSEVLLIESWWYVSRGSDTSGSYRKAGPSSATWITSLWWGLWHVYLIRWRASVATWHM
jgi:hypothetical protein